MNPSTVNAVEPVVEQAAQVNPWLPSAPADTAWLDAAKPAVAPEHAGGLHLTQIFDGALPLESWINQGLGWVVAHCRPFFQTVRAPIDATLNGVGALLLAAPSLVVIAIIGLLAWQFTSRALAVGTVLALLVVSMLGVWPEAMITLSLVLTSLAFCLLIGLPLGIFLASSYRAQNILRPLLDAMQTTPAFVYLVPVVMLFGIGNAPGVIVTIIFALAPLVRLTNLGIRQVRPDLIEAARAYGASPWQLLTRVQFPLAMPSIMAGINQSLMLSLSMVVIASMIAVGGLGQMVLRGIGRLDMGLATVGGLGIVLLAITLDRLTQAMGQPRRGVRHWYQTGPAGLILRLVRNGPVRGQFQWLSMLALCVLVLTTSLAMAQTPDDCLPGKGIKVQALQSSIAEETFQTMLVDRALEKLGYEPQPIKEVDYPAAHIAIANGDATFLAVHWDPLHQDYYNNAGGDAKLLRTGQYAGPAAQGYMIDKATADKYNITNIEQLRDPGLAKLFDHDGDGKADLTGCNPGWGCEAMIENHLDAYQLRATVKHVQGSYAALMADTIGRHQRGEPILYYTWTPYWVSGVLVPGKDVVWLQVPFSSNPQHSSTRMDDGSDYGFAVNTTRIVVNRAWAEQNPAAVKLFEVMRLPIADINAQNQRMRDGENSQADIARHTDGWIKYHQQLFDSWIAHARQNIKN